MAEGIRIQPCIPCPGDAMVVVVDHARPFDQPPGYTQPSCSICGVPHFAKNYHIQLIAGSAIISTGVWDALRGLAENPFEVANPVPEPPTQHIVLPSASLSISAGTI